ncbi:hypothetical protein TcWFU_006280 [Taenia crassiceps]|uniref:Uncharacterized protein n=1 Tax=Taenia crassiceps TaxID=6207 RepID=A0ABR4QIA8_9CEST
MTITITITIYDLRLSCWRLGRADATTQRRFGDRTVRASVTIIKPPNRSLRCRQPDGHSPFHRRLHRHLQQTSTVDTPNPWWWWWCMHLLKPLLCPTLWSCAEHCQCGVLVLDQCIHRWAQDERSGHEVSEEYLTRILNMLWYWFQCGQPVKLSLQRTHYV